MTKQAQLFAALPDAEKPKPPTPLMQQYLAIKTEAGADTILLYRMGDFYEIFFQDAERAAPALDICLTKRGKHEGRAIPMAGVPVHSSERYITQLVEKGFKVAICEETETRAETMKRGRQAIARREILRVLSPNP